MIYGRRVYNKQAHELQEGDYCLNEDGRMLVFPPAACVADISKHKIIEHKDGTISAEPSILISTTDDNDPPRPVEVWHGYLERGMWRPC